MRFLPNNEKKFAVNYRDFVKFYNQIYDKITVTKLWEDGPDFEEGSTTSHEDTYEDDTLPVWGANIVFESLSFMDDHKIFSIVEDFGLIIKRRVTRNTDYVVVNNLDDNNKLIETADKYEIEILNIEEFKNLFG